MKEKEPKFKRINFSVIRKALYIYYSAPLTNTFKKFRSGLIYFTVGMFIIFMANQNMTPSVQQDLVTLFGLIMVAVGFLIAIMAHIRLIISRILHFLTKK